MLRKKVGAEKAAMTVKEHIPYMCEVLGFMPSTLEVEAGGAEVQGHPQLSSEFETRHGHAPATRPSLPRRRRTGSSDHEGPDRAFLPRADLVKKFVQ